MKQNRKQRNFNNIMQWLDRLCRYKTGVGRELARAAPSGWFRSRNLTMSRGKEGEGLQDPHRRQIEAAR
jgi:hypothetical protein